MTPTTQGHVIAVRPGTNSYDIHIDSDVLGTAQSLVAPIATDRKVVIITDSHVAPLHLAKTEQLFSPMAASVHSLIVPAGEASKYPRRICLTRVTSRESSADDIISQNDDFLFSIDLYRDGV